LRERVSHRTLKYPSSGKLFYGGGIQFSTPHFNGYELNVDEKIPLMTPPIFRCTRRSVVGFLVLGAFSGCRPAVPLDAQEFPAADILIARYVEALGGRERFASIQSIRTLGTTLIPAMGLQAEFELVQGAPNRMVLRVTVPGLGEILNGFDGRIGWSIDPLIGPSLTEGAELVQTAEESQILAALRDSEFVVSKETIEETAYAGIPCWRVNIVWASGRTSSDCYSSESGLLIATEEVQATVMGEIPSTTLFFEYRNFDGRLFPTRIVQQAMGQEQEMRVQSVEYDAVEPAAFALPPAIRTLLTEGGQ
jgi:hypothetical protein